MKRTKSSLSLPLGMLFFALGICTSFAGENPTEALEAPDVEVVGSTPLPGLGTALKDVPSNVQLLNRESIGRGSVSNLETLLDRDVISVNINSSQGNPYQSDVNYRGFTASPLLGTPQGLSVFQDGVRINESFGDVVNWDFLPASAISTIQVIPGVNPAYGLNTLGAALAIYTKSGSQYPEKSVEGTVGSFGEKSAGFTLGGKDGNTDVFLTARESNDRGWAQHNPSHIRQAFGKIGWQDEKSDLDISISLADNTLEGQQTIPQSWFDDIRTPYTYPDRNHNQLQSISTKGSRYLDNQTILGGNIYFRKTRFDSYASNANDDYDPEEEDDDSHQATNDGSTIRQESYGVGLQITKLATIAGLENQFAVGISTDIGRTQYDMYSQPATFTSDRGTQGVGDFQQEVGARTKNNNLGIFANDIITLNKKLTLTVGGRLDRTTINIEDIQGNTPALNGSHFFTHFSPGVGLNYNPSPQLTNYISLHESSRTPTAIELTCADPAAPCKLPNNFISDPPLKLVIARTLELGFRLNPSEQRKIGAAIFRSDLKDDLQFVAANNIAGYFKNVGTTRRQGLEINYSERWGSNQRYNFDMRYSYIRATFESPFDVNAPANTSADSSGTIHVHPGDRIPGIPLQSAKFRFAHRPTGGAELGLNAQIYGGSYARGDENNQDKRGTIPGYAVFGLDGNYNFNKRFAMFANVANLFDRRYANIGALGYNEFTGKNRSYDPSNRASTLFEGPGVPRALSLGLRYQWI